MTLEQMAPGIHAGGPGLPAGAVAEVIRRAGARVVVGHPTFHNEGTIGDLLRRGIAGALFIVLQPGISIDEFQWTEDEVYTYGETDNKGYYTLPDMLARDEYYSMLIGADGYEPIMEDDIYIPDDIESPFELNIELYKAQ